MVGVPSRRRRNERIVIGPSGKRRASQRKRERDREQRGWGNRLIARDRIYPLDNDTVDSYR